MNAKSVQTVSNAQRLSVNFSYWFLIIKIGRFRNNFLCSRPLPPLPPLRRLIFALWAHVIPSFSLMIAINNFNYFLNSKRFPRERFERALHASLSLPVIAEQLDCRPPGRVKRKYADFSSDRFAARSDASNFMICEPSKYSRSNSAALAPRSRSHRVSRPSMSESEWERNDFELIA